MSKSNKRIYPFQMSSNPKIDWDLIKKDFAKSKEFDNFEKIPDRKYLASLVFLAEKGDLLFFSLSKCNDHNITVADFAQKKDYHSYLKAKQRVKNHALFAVHKKHNLLLVLYNYDAFGYVCPTLHSYLKKKLNINFTCHPLVKDYTPSDINSLFKSAVHVVIKKAIKNYRKYEQTIQGSSRKKIRKYTESHEEIIKLLRLKNMPLGKKLDLLNPFIKEKDKYDKIIISGENIGEVDILDQFRINFDCDVSTDKDGLSSITNFQNEVENICSTKENIELFEQYTLNSD